MDSQSMGAKSEAKQSVVPMIAVLSNMKSTTNMRGIDKVRNVMTSGANIVHFEIESPSEIDEALALFARSNPAVLVINGGDGTIGLVFQALLYRNPFVKTPPIAFLPGGKTNMTAADLGYKGKPEKNLKKIIDRVNRGDLSSSLEDRNIIELDMGDGSKEPHVGTFFGGAGAVKGILWCREYAYSKGLPNSIAHLSALFSLLMAAFGLGTNKDIMKSDPIDAYVVGRSRLGGQYVVITITTLNKLLFGMKPFDADLEGGLKFAAIETGPKTVLKALGGLITGTFGKKVRPGIHVRASDEIRITTTDPVTLDGEIYTPVKDTPIIVKGDRSLTFLSLEKKA